MRGSVLEDTNYLNITRITLHDTKFQRIGDMHDIVIRHCAHTRELYVEYEMRRCINRCSCLNIDEGNMIRGRKDELNGDNTALLCIIQRSNAPL
jgi:hypothetical protein